jgi:hypothetical protein
MNQVITRGVTLRGGPVGCLSHPRVSDLRPHRGGQSEESNLRVLQEPQRTHEDRAGAVALRMQASLPGAHVHGGGAPPVLLIDGD